VNVEVSVADLEAVVVGEDADVAGAVDADVVVEARRETRNGFQ
jgi:hypothetical protein